MPRVLTERLEHAEAGDSDSVSDDHRLVDERGEHFGGVTTDIADVDDLLDGVEFEPAGEDGEALEDDSFRLVELVVAPVDRRPHRAVSFVRPRWGVGSSSKLASRRAASPATPSVRTWEAASSMANGMPSR